MLTTGARRKDVTLAKSLVKGVDWREQVAKQMRELGVKAHPRLLLQLIDLGHVVSVLLLPICNLTLQLGRMVLVGLQVLQPQPELLHLACLLCSQLAHLLEGLRGAPHTGEMQFMQQPHTL